MTEELAPLSALERIANPLESITELSSIDDLNEAVSNARGILAKMKETLKTCQAEYEEQVLAIIEVRGSFQLGHDKYVKSVKKKETQSDADIILKDLIKATNGNVVHIANCLGSGAFKKGEVKKILGDDCEYFKSVPTDTLKKSVLKSYNVNFIPEKKKCQ